MLTSRRLFVRCRDRFVVILIGIAFTICLSAHKANAGTWPGPTFKEFSGVNQLWSNSDPLLYTGVLGWERHDFPFDEVEPAKGKWNETALKRYQADALGYKRAGAAYLPMLGYMANWAGPDNGAPTDEAAWTEFVKKAVETLRPCGTTYFQIWNEASPKFQGFYNGNYDDYMSRIHFPAAAIIHAAGCKVVWGGWPACNGPTCDTPQDFIAMMDKYHAWGSIDVVDLHYFHWWDLDLIRKAAMARGYKKLAYWQTELGWTDNPLFICDEYPGALQWALTSGLWTAKDRFKYFYFAGNGSGTKTLRPGDMNGPLNAHGLILKNLAGLLGGGTLSALRDVHGIGLNSGSSLASFNVGRSKSVIAVELSQKDYNAATTLTLTLPIARKRIRSVERVDLDGSHIDNVTSALHANASSTTLTVSTRDAPGSNAARWNSAVAGNDAAVFYVRINL